MSAKTIKSMKNRKLHKSQRRAKPTWPPQNGVKMSKVEYKSFSEWMIKVDECDAIYKLNHLRAQFKDCEAWYSDAEVSFAMEHFEAKKNELSPK